VAYSLQPPWTSLEEIVSAYPAGLRIDLGCGYAKPDGFIGLDNLVGERTQIRDEAHGPDILIDLNREPLPFDDNSCAEVRSSHFLEHSLLDHVIDETFRVLRPDGSFLFVVPYANSADGMYPGHSAFLTEKWFHLNPNFQSKFRIVEERYDPSEEYQRLPFYIRLLFPFDRARLFFFNACVQMMIRALPRK
jgi:predicted SAM-dependent methyltransferase